MSIKNTLSDASDETYVPGHLMLGLLEGFIWLDQGLQQNLNAAGLPNVRRLESMLMLYAAAGICRPTELAKKLGVTRQSVNSAIRDLETKRLIKLQPDPSDQRCKIIELDPAGEPIHSAALSIISQLEQHLEAKLGSKQTAQLRKQLGRDWGETPMLSE